MLRSVTLLSRLCVLVPLVLAGCAAGSDPVHGLVSGIGLLPDQPEPKDFVKAARPDMDKIDYMPVEFNPQEHKLPVRTKAEAAADDRALQAAAAKGGATLQATDTKPKAKAKIKKIPALDPDSDTQPTQN